MKAHVSKIAAFLKSPHHAWLALLTLGLGVASLSMVGLIAGAAAYGLGWLYLPDSKVFGKWLDGRKAVETGGETRDFLHQRRMLFDALSPAGRTEYQKLAQSAEELRKSLQSDGRMSKDLVARRSERLAQFAWTYLRLVHTGEKLSRLLESEEAAELTRQVEALDREVKDLRESATAAGSSGDRLIESKSSRLDSLRQRQERHDEAATSLKLTLAEKERIVDLLKLMRADYLASRDANLLSHEIDGASMELDRTQDWLRELEFDNSPSDVPDSVTAAVPLEIGRG